MCSLLFLFTDRYAGTDTDADADTDINNSDHQRERATGGVRRGGGDGKRGRRGMDRVGGGGGGHALGGGAHCGCVASPAKRRVGQTLDASCVTDTHTSSRVSLVLSKAAVSEDVRSAYSSIKMSSNA